MGAFLVLCYILCFAVEWMGDWMVRTVAGLGWLTDLVVLLVDWIAGL